MSSPFARLRLAERLDGDAALLLRRCVFDDDAVTTDEVRALIGLARAVPEADAPFVQFYCEAITDWAALQREPEGYVSEETARALTAILGEPGETTALERQAMTHLCAQTRSVPDVLVGFALLSYRAHALATGTVDADTVLGLGQLIYAAGGAGRIGVTRAEAELLFDVNDAAPGENDAGWAPLFAQTITAYLFSHAGYAAPDRAEALRLDRFVSAPDSMRFAAQRGGPGFARTLWHGLTGHDAAEAFRADLASERARLADAATVLTGAEVAWLATRVRKDGAICAAERALIARVRTLAAEHGQTLPAAVAALAS